MRIRVTKPFNGYRKGQEFDWPDGMARIFLGRGMVEEVFPDREVVVERADSETQVEKAVATSRKKKP